MKTHLLDFFEETADKKADDTAVIHNNEAISYGELRDKARKLGAHISSLTNDSVNKPIAVLLPKEINTVVADLGIMYSCNPFMNLDIKTPVERLSNIFELIKPLMIITSSKYQKIIDGIELPVVFDIYDFELCMLMVNGSKLVLLDAMFAAFPARLLEKMADTKVNFIFWVPSIMVNIANMGLLDKIALPDLKLVWFAGEVFPTKQFLVWYDKLPNTVFANLYGPIEITLDCTYYVIDERPVESEPLPIGIPYINTDVLILNEENKLCSIGEEGELCVRGTSLAMGYYNNPEKTAAAFTQNPLNTSYPDFIYRTGDMAYVREDGNIMFKGRKDSLIKHMGYRIELGEIEHVIENDLKLVKYCCAVYRSAQKEIVLYYENESEISDKDFRSAISKVFPAYMIPAVYIKMDELPRNTNGKIDRLLLKNKANEES